MKIRFLGTGTSTGIPQIGCQCSVCKSRDSRDNRLRSSVYFSTYKTKILIDCGPDFRQQILKVPFAPLDAVLLTHEHYDHVGGLDDLRSYSRFGKVQVYAEDYVCDRIYTRIPYCFAEKRYEGVPRIELNGIEPGKNFTIGDITITPLRVIHGRLPILGYKLNDVAYITDMLYAPEETYNLLKGVRVLIINALREEKHISHQTLQDALVFSERVKAKKTYLIHMSHDMGLHLEVEKKLPSNVFLAYDNLELI